MTDFRNNFPRGSKAPTQGSTAQNSKASEGKSGASVLEGYGAGGSQGGQNRDMEANTADGRGSHAQTFVDSSVQSGDVGQDVGQDDALVTNVAPYGGQPQGTNSQGGMARDLPGGPSGIPFDS